MEVRKLGLGWYLWRTVSLAAPTGGLVGFLAGQASLATTDPLAAVVIGAIGGSMMGVGISARNYIQLIAPMKRIMEKVELLAQRTGAKQATRLGTVADLELAFHRIIENLVDQLDKTVNQLLSGMQQLEHFAELTSARAAETATTVKDLTINVEQTNANVQRFSEDISQVENKVQRSYHNFSNAAANVQALVGTTERIADLIGQLEQRTGKITKILEFITDISSETNLLALNAAIEAARAGQAGRSFAVVAQQVRQLADQSAGATKEIKQILTGIVETTHQATAAAQEESQRVRHEILRLNEIQKEIEELGSVITSFLQRIHKFPDLITSIAQALEKISVTAADTDTATREVVTVAQRLGGLAKDLAVLVERLRVDF